MLEGLAAGDSVAAIIVDGSIRDADGAAVESIAITAVDDTNGTWQYTLDGSTWLDMGSVSTSSALLLPGDGVSRFRFVPNADYSGSSGMLNYKAWDQTSGSAGSYADVTTSGGTTAFSSGTNGGALTVDPVNDAPAIAEITPLHSDEDVALDLALPAGIVSDPDGDNLTVTLTLADGWRAWFTGSLGG